MTTTTPARIAEIEARHAAHPTHPKLIAIRDPEEQRRAIFASEAFHGNAHADVAYLLAHVKALEAALAKQKERCDELWKSRGEAAEYAEGIDDMLDVIVPMKRTDGSGLRLKERVQILVAEVQKARAAATPHTEALAKD